MKIHADKTEGDPPHALRLRDVRTILRGVPPEWIEGVKEVHLSNALGSPHVFFSRYDGRLTICSRSGTVKQILVAILMELANCALNFKMRSRHRRSKAEEHRLAQIVRPYVEKILPTLTPKTVKSKEKRISCPPPPPFKPVIFKFFESSDET